MGNAIHLVPQTRAFRREGLKGTVAVNVDAEERVLRFAGTDGGIFDLPLDDIESIRVGVIYGRVTRYRTLIRRSDGGRTIRIDGRFPNYYPDFIWHLAEEMERGGQLDRIWGGVPLMLSWGPVVVLLGLGLAIVVPLGIFEQTPQPPRDGLLIALAGGGGGLGVAIYGLVHYLRWEKPRRLQRIEELARFLP